MWLSDHLKRIKQMFSLEVIWTSSSPYASLMVVVKIKDGSDRICDNYRKVNKLTVTVP